MAVKNEIYVRKFCVQVKVFHLLIVIVFLDSPIDIEIMTNRIGIIRHFLHKSMA